MNRKIILISLLFLLIILIFLNILNILNKKTENFVAVQIGPVVTSDLSSTNQSLSLLNTTTSLILSSVDQNTSSSYNSLYQKYLSQFNSIPSYPSYTTQATYDKTLNAYICPSSSPIPSLSNGKIVCSPTDTLSSFDCIPGTTITYSECNGTIGKATRSGDIPAIGINGASCPYNSWNVSCSNCLGSWGSWGACSASCGGGTQNQTYTITQEAINGGSQCPSSNGATQTQSCNTQACNVNCVGSWSSMQASIGGTIQTFNVYTPSSGTGTVCPYANGQTATFYTFSIKASPVIGSSPLSSPYTIGNPKKAGTLFYVSMTLTGQSGSGLSSLSVGGTRLLSFIFPGNTVASYVSVPVATNYVFQITIPSTGGVISGQISAGSPLSYSKTQSSWTGGTLTYGILN